MRDRASALPVELAGVLFAFLQCFARFLSWVDLAHLLPIPRIFKRGKRVRVINLHPRDRCVKTRCWTLQGKCLASAITRCSLCSSRFLLIASTPATCPSSSGLAPIRETFVVEGRHPQQRPQGRWFGEFDFSASFSAWAGNPRRFVCVCVQLWWRISMRLGFVCCVS